MDLANFGIVSNAVTSVNKCKLSQLVVCFWMHMTWIAICMTSA